MINGTSLSEVHGFGPGECRGAIWLVWNSFKTRLFLLHPPIILNIDGVEQSPSIPHCALSMIVCSCNVFTDHDVRNAVSVAQMPPRTPGQIYGCLGCSAQCGRCVRTIKKIMDEALGACAKSCCSGCPHGHQSEAGTEAAEFAVQAAA